MPTIDPDVQKHYEDYFEMFSTSGWKGLMEDLNAALEHDRTTAAARCDTNDKWQFERGMQAKTAVFLNFENVIRDAYDRLTNPEPEYTTEGTVEEGLFTE